MVVVRHGVGDEHDGYKDASADDEDDDHHDGGAADAVEQDELALGLREVGWDARGLAVSA